jgi:hypothetical protein
MHVNAVRGGCRQYVLLDQLWQCCSRQLSRARRSKQTLKFRCYVIVFLCKADLSIYKSASMRLAMRKQASQKQKDGPDNIQHLVLPPQALDLETTVAARRRVLWPP